MTREEMIERVQREVDRGNLVVRDPDALLAFLREIYARGWNDCSDAFHLGATIVPEHNL